MKSIILLAMLVVGIASCETPQPATGTDETTTPTTTGVTGSDTTTTTTGSGTTGSGTTGTGSGTDTSSKGTGRDTTTTKRDSLPK